MGLQTRFTEVKFNFDVSDYYREYYTEMLYFHDDYSRWVGDLIDSDSRLVKSACGGEVHLQLSFNLISNMELLKMIISSSDWYSEYCTKVSLVLHGVRNITSTMKKLGLHVYSKEPQALAVWTKGSGWKTEKIATEQFGIEVMTYEDPFDGELPTEVEVEMNEIDWYFL